MSPLNRGPLLGGARAPPVRPLPPPRFGGRLPPGMPPRMPPPLNPVFGGPMRQRLPPPPRSGGVSRPNGMLPMFPGPRARGMAPGMVPPMGPRGAAMPHPLMRPWPRRIPPPRMMPPMRPRFTGNGNVKGKTANNTKKANKLEELELKKPWMTDEIRSEIQKKNKLYAKAKKNKDAIEWEEFKDLRNKVTRMIRDAKNEYLSKHPEQGGQKTDDNTIESEGVQKTENSTEQSEQKEQTEETQPSSEQADLYRDDEEPYDQEDEDDVSYDDDTSYYCGVCDKNFSSEDTLTEHKSMHMLCDIDGCTFAAHPSLVEKHINMHHSTDLNQKTKNSPTLEDIEWAMQRKKKFPTNANIELRKEKELEKVQRGEVIKQNSRVQIRTKRTTSSRERKRKSRKRQTREIASNCSRTDETYRGLRPFSGTSSLQEEDSNEECLNEQIKTNAVIDNISDEDDMPQAFIELTPIPLPVHSLVANYESDEEDEMPEEVSIKKIEDSQEHMIAKDTTVCKEILNGTSSCIIENDKSNNQITTDRISQQSSVAKHQDKLKHGMNRIAKDKRYGKVHNKYSNTLLETLLSRPIQQERNFICQCLKYIVDNNFFETC